MNGYAQDRLRAAGAKSKRARYVIERSSYFDFASLRSIRTEVSANFNELPGNTKEGGLKRPTFPSSTATNHGALNAGHFGNTLIEDGT